MTDDIDIADDDYDSPWKLIIEALFPSFLSFYFPKVNVLIDWAQPVTFMDKELQAIYKDSDEGRKYVDKLVRVYLKNGKEQWLLIHIEVQSTRDPRFPVRMFVYHYRIYEIHGREVIRAWPCSATPMRPGAHRGSPMRTGVVSCR